MLSNIRLRGWLIIILGLTLEILVWNQLLLVAPKALLLRKILLVVIPVLTSAIVELLIFQRMRPDLTSFLQVLWDKKGNVYCPHCKTLFVQTQEECKDDKRIHALKCMNQQCNQESIFLRNDKGQPLRLRIAKKMLGDRLNLGIPLDPVND